MQKQRMIDNVEGEDKESTWRKGTQEADRVNRKHEVEEEMEEVKRWEGEMCRGDLGQDDVKDEQRLRESHEGGGRAGRTQRSKSLKRRAVSEGLLSLLLVLSRLSLGLGKHIEGTLRTTENWAFITRFCFLSNGSTINFDVEQDMDLSGQRIILYYDEPDQWPAVYKTDKTCLEKEAVVKPEYNQIIELAVDSIECATMPQSPEGARAKIQCQGNRTFTSQGEHWWFIAISNCESDQGLQLKYSFTMTNGEDHWYKHFSADESYMQQIYLIALGLQLVLFFLCFVAAAKLKNQQQFRTTYLIFMCAVGLHACFLVLGSLHYVCYRYNGVGFANSLLAGRVLSACSYVLMVLLLFLTGKGFNITHCRLQGTLALRLAVFMSVFALMYASLFILECAFFDPGLYLYIYESPIGYCRMVPHLVGLILFLGACLSTLGSSPLMTTFYYPFFSFYTFWFVAGPLNILIISVTLYKLDREQAALCVELAITFVGHAFFLFLTRPCEANKNFPYRLKKIQVRQMPEVVENNTEMDVISTTSSSNESHGHKEADAMPPAKPPDLGKATTAESSGPDSQPLPNHESGRASMDKNEHEVAKVSNSFTNQPAKESNNIDAKAAAPPIVRSESKAKC